MIQISKETAMLLLADSNHLGKHIARDCIDHEVHFHYQKWTGELWGITIRGFHPITRMWDWMFV
jgi:hypothetical protein